MAIRIIQIAIPFIWFGMLGAISFLEAPLKFRAPGISLGLGLGIGRLVFQALNITEIVMAVILIATLFAVRPKRNSISVLFGIICLLLLLQTIWLLPALDARAEQIIQGGTPEASSLHLIYIFFELIKFFGLAVMGVLLLKSNLQGAIQGGGNNEKRH